MVKIKLKPVTEYATLGFATVVLYETLNVPELGSLSR